MLGATHSSPTKGEAEVAAHLMVQTWPHGETHLVCTRDRLVFVTCFNFCFTQF